MGSQNGGGWSMRGRNGRAWGRSLGGQGLFWVAWVSGASKEGLVWGGA